MRLFLLPISTRRTLIYCEKVKAGPSTSYADWAVNKASATWSQWESKDKGWQKKLTEYGNRVFSRLPFEEWGLKTLPALTQKTRDAAGRTQVLFPGSFMDKARVPDILRQLATERQGLHQKKMTWSILAMPLTIPIGILPVVPNIPFFYLAFRAWSHYKALYGSRYLNLLLDNKLIDLAPSRDLDHLYTAGLRHPTREKARKAGAPPKDEIEFISKKVQDETGDSMLLSRWNGKLVAERFALPEMEIEIERAVEQVERSIKAEKELKAQKLESEQRVTATTEVEKKK